MAIGEYRSEWFIAFIEKLMRDVGKTRVEWNFFWLPKKIQNKWYWGPCYRLETFKKVPNKRASELEAPFQVSDNESVGWKIVECFWLRTSKHLETLRVCYSEAYASD